MDKDWIIKDVESQLDHQIKGFGLIGMNPKTEKNVKYFEDLDKITHDEFLTYAYINYATFRFLCEHHFSFYPFFLGHQCIENYLKAYIKFKKGKHKDGHDLKDLLKNAKKIDKDKNDSFIQSDRIKYIVESFNRYYEITRYPVAKNKKLSKDKSGIISVSYSHPTRTYILDYFVYKMREIIPKSEKDDIFSNKFPFTLLSLDNEHEDMIWKIIKKDNINFL